MSESKLIHHCSLVDLKGGGGIETYLASLLKISQSDVSTQVLKSLNTIDQKQFKLLHVHDYRLLPEISGECPTIFTAHNHITYCPSGTQYLEISKRCCDRNFSYLACSWGHFIDGCGSRRPQNVINNLNTTQQSISTLRQLKIPIIAVSNYIRCQFVKNGIPDNQIVTLHLGISTPINRTEPLNIEDHRKQRILFAGRIVPPKGLEWLLKALTQTESHIHLDIAGDGWDRPRMEQLAQKLGLNDRITWHGWCQPDKLRTLYDQSLAVVFPSVWPEPAGLVTLESYAHYRPIIASAVGGIPEYIQDRETGILVPANDVKGLANAISYLAKNYEVSKLMGQRGHGLFLNKFTIQTHIEGLQEKYASTMLCFQNKTSVKSYF